MWKLTLRSKNSAKIGRKDYKLLLHLGKTKSILFGSKPRLRSQSNLKIECKGSVTEPKDNVKYLGQFWDKL